MARLGWVTATAAVALVLALPAGAAATGGGTDTDGKPKDKGGQTVRTVVHIPVTVLDNLCNGEPVSLSGDLYITTRTKPDPRGGYTVQSRSHAPNLKGTGLVTMLPYKGADGEDNYAYYAPPPFPSTLSVTHYTKLVPKGPAPSMWLVFVLRETVAADGTVIPTLERTYIDCHGPHR